MPKQQHKSEQEILTITNLTDYRAEESVLGCILIDPESIHEIGHFLKPEYFHREIHRWVYKIFLDLVQEGTPIDSVIVIGRLEKQGNLEETGGESLLSSFMSTVPTSINVVHYAQIVEAMAVRRQLIAAASAIANLAGDNDTKLEEVVGQAESIIFDVSHKRSSSKIKHIKDVASEHMEHMSYLSENGRPNGISTGFSDMDWALSANGMEKGQLIMIAGDTAMGKSALALDIATNVAKKGHPAAFFTLEMTERQLFQRRVSADCKIPSNKLKDPQQLTEEEWARYYKSVGSLSEIPLYIDESPFLTPMQLLSKCRRLQARSGLDLIVVDYLALMGADGIFNNETLRLAYISRTLKLIAKELNVVLIVCAQLNGKQIAQRADKRPQLADLRFSSDPNNDSDIVLFIYRDEYYNPETTDKPNIGEVIFAKQREGISQIIVDLYWQAQYMSFRDLARSSEESSMVPAKSESWPDYASYDN